MSLGKKLFLFIMWAFFSYAGPFLLSGLFEIINLNSISYFISSLIFRILFALLLGGLFLYLGKKDIDKTTNSTD